MKKSVIIGIIGIIIILVIVGYFYLEKQKPTLEDDDMFDEEGDDMLDEAECPYECCGNEIYDTKTCAAGFICYENKCYLEGQEVEILKDTKFEWGFADAGGASSLPDGIRCEMPVQGKKPVWEIAEIATETHFCANLPNPKSTEPILFESENGYKKLYSYKDGRIKLQLDTSAEEKQGCVITNPLVSITNWVDYGVRQPTLVDFADFEELNFNTDVKLNKFESNIPKQKCSEYGSIVDRYGEFMIIFLLKRKDDKGPNNWFWLLVVTCSKHWWPGQYEEIPEHKECVSNSAEYIMGDQFEISMYHAAMDTGIPFRSSDERVGEEEEIITGYVVGKIISTSVGSIGRLPMLKKGEWVTYNFDVKKFAEDAIKYYNKRFQSDLNLDDYNLAHVSFDWEIVGGFDTDIELKDSSLKGKFVVK